MKLLLFIFIFSLVFEVKAYEKKEISNSVELGRYQGKVFPGNWLSYWDHQQRVDWYTTTQGSQFIDFRVFMSIVVEKDGVLLPFYKTMQDPENKYGFVYPRDQATLKQFSQDLGKSKDGLDYGRLPFGVMIDKNIKGNGKLGMTCAACHTGQLQVNGQEYFIDAGTTSQLKFDYFLKDLRDQLKNNLYNSRLKKAYRKNMIKTPYSWSDSYRGTTNLNRIRIANNLLEQSFKEADRFVKNNVSDELHSKSGRIDAVTAILNEVLVEDLKTDNPGANLGKAIAPISIPAIWDAPIMQCVQTNCLSTNPLTRNYGEVLGVFGSIDLTPDWRDFDKKSDKIPDLIEGDFLKSSVQMDNLITLEKTLETLTSPSWPEELKGFEIDNTKWNKGRKLYMAECASCHAPVEKDLAGKYIFNDQNIFNNPRSTEWKDLGVVVPEDQKLLRVEKINYKRIGTDPQFIELHGNRTASAGILQSMAQKAVEKIKANPNLDIEKFNLVKEIEQIISAKPESVPALLLLGFVTSAGSQNYLRDAGLSQQEKAEISHYRFSPKSVKEILGMSAEDIINADENTELHGVYKARPLNGIAFTAPFLHNGSVPTLKALLDPPLKPSIDYKGDIRPSSFYVGNKTFDTKNVGFTWNKKDSALAVEFHVYDQSGNVINGNSNMGHMYGVGLNPVQKEQLLEYVKTL